MMSEFETMEQSGLDPEEMAGAAVGEGAAKDGSDDASSPPAILSEEEVGALFEAVQMNGDADGEVDVQPFELREIAQTSADLERLVGRVNAQIMVDASAALSAVLRLAAAVELGPPTMNHPLGSTDCVLHIGERGAKPVVSFVVPEDLIKAFADRALGGPGRPSAPGRPLSDLEKRVSKRTLMELGDVLEHAWEQTLEIPLELRRDDHVALSTFGSSPVGSFTIKVGDRDFEGACVYDATSLRHAVEGRAEPASERGLCDRISSLPLGVGVRSGGFLLTVRELLEIAPGQVLDLGAAADMRVDVRVEGRARYRGSLRADERGRRVVIEESTRPPARAQGAQA